MERSQFLEVLHQIVHSAACVRRVNLLFCRSLATQAPRCIRQKTSPVLSCPDMLCLYLMVWPEKRTGEEKESESNSSQMMRPSNSCTRTYRYLSYGTKRRSTWITPCQRGKATKKEPKNAMSYASCDDYTPDRLYPGCVRVRATQFSPFPAQSKTHIIKCGGGLNVESDKWNKVISM